MLPGSAVTVTNGRGPKSCLGRVFNSKLGRIATINSELGRIATINSKLGAIAAMFSKCLARMQKTLLELKTRPRARPVSYSLSMVLQITP